MIEQTKGEDGDELPVDTFQNQAANGSRATLTVVPVL